MGGSGPRAPSQPPCSSRVLLPCQQPPIVFLCFLQREAPLRSGSGERREVRSSRMRLPPAPGRWLLLLQGIQSGRAVGEGQERCQPHQRKRKSQATTMPPGWYFQPQVGISNSREAAPSQPPWCLRWVLPSARSWLGRGSKVSSAEQAQFPPTASSPPWLLFLL